MHRSDAKDVWAAGKLYEPYVGRWSRRVAEQFVKWLAVPEGKDWLDVGCGTGALTTCILNHGDPNAVTGVDRSAGFIEYTRARVTSRHARFEVADAQSLPFARAAFDAAVAGLVLNFVAEPRLAVAEMARVVRPGGVAAAYVWDYAGKMELMRYLWDAAVALDPAARDLDEGRRFPLCQPKPLTELFARVGLDDVEVRPLDIPTDFVDFEDYWTPFLGGQGPAPGYVMSLDERRRAALRERLRAGLPAAENGAIRLVARAWAVRARWA